MVNKENENVYWYLFWVAWYFLLKELIDLFRFLLIYLLAEATQRNVCIGSFEKRIKFSSAYPRVHIHMVSIGKSSKVTAKQRPTKFLYVFVYSNLAQLCIAYKSGMCMPLKYSSFDTDCIFMYRQARYCIKLHRCTVLDEYFFACNPPKALPSNQHSINALNNKSNEKFSSKIMCTNKLLSILLCFIYIFFFLLLFMANHTKKMCDVWVLNNVRFFRNIFVVFA